MEDAVEAEKAREGGDLGAGVRRQREGRERRGGRGGVDGGGGGREAALAEEEPGDGRCEGGRFRRQDVLAGKHHKRVIGGAMTRFNTLKNCHKNHLEICQENNYEKQDKI